MAVIKAVSSKASIGKAIDYVTKEEKTEQKLLSGKDCNPLTAKEEMNITKMFYHKTKGRTYKHFVQSFHKDEKITSEQAHQLANQLAEKCKQFQGFEVLIATHQDREHIHTHFIVNSVNFKDGHKFNMSKKDLQEMKNLSDELCEVRGLHICEKGKTFEGKEREETTAYKKEAYQLLKKAENGKIKSYIQEIGLAVLECKGKAKNQDDFIEKMKEKGIGVSWQDNHKYITFTHLQRQEQGEKQCKIRNNKLEKYYHLKLGKEDLKNEFEENIRRKESDRNKSEQEFGGIKSTKSNVKNGTGEFVAERGTGGISSSISEIERGTKQFSAEYGENERNTGDENKPFRKYDSNSKQEYERDDEPSIRSFRNRDYEFER